MPFAVLPEAAAADANSVYEDVCNGGDGPEGKDCVTIISVTPSFLAAAAAAAASASASGASQDGGGSATPRDYATPSEASSDRGSFTVHSQDGGRTGGTAAARKSGGRPPRNHGDHTYENLEFHRVKISVPGHNGGRPFLLNNAASSSGCLDRRKRAPNNVVNSRVIRRAGRVKGARPNGCVTAGQSAVAVAAAAQSLSEQEYRKRFEKFGYSRNEVWNWLYTDEEEPSAVEKRLIADLYSIPEKRRTKGAPPQVAEQKEEEEGDDKTVEVKFTPQEFVDRWALAELNTCTLLINLRTDNW